MKHIIPSIGAKSFHCPNCGVLTEHTWSAKIFCEYVYSHPSGQQQPNRYILDNYKIAKCIHCKKFSIWLVDKMIYPLSGTVEIANPDLPDEIKEDYNEARNIVNISPRGAAALLRLAIQKLCIHLGEKGKRINDDIASLVEKGLPKTMQQALDSVRVIGNDAVHPGKIDLNDNIEIAYSLFAFVNIICEFMISQPNKIQEFYEINIPEGVKLSIENRDK